MWKGIISMKYDNFTTLFDSICEIKKNVVKLSLEERASFKSQFFNLNFSEWSLNLLWEFIWDDKSYNEILYIFTQKKMIKREGDQLGKR